MSRTARVSGTMSLDGEWTRIVSRPSAARILEGDSSGFDFSAKFLQCVAVVQRAQNPNAGYVLIDRICR